MRLLTVPISHGIVAAMKTSPLYRFLIVLFTFLFTSISCNLPSIASNLPPTSDAGDNPVSEATTSSENQDEGPITAPISRKSPGEQALFFGDWELAISLFEQDRNSDDHATQSAGAFGLARTYYAMGDLQNALGQATALISEFPDSAERPATFFLLGQIFSELGQPAESASAYQEYQTLRPGLIDHYVHERIGDAFWAAGETTQAINAYQLGISAESVIGNDNLQIKIGNVYANAGDPNTAIVTYQDVLARTNNDFTKALMLRSIGENYLYLGENDLAYAAFQQAVNNYPFSHDAYLSLVYLIEAEQPVNELNRGIINYTISQYSLAVSALDRFMAENPNHDDTPHYYKAFSFVNTGQYEAAINEFQKIIDNFPTGNYYSTAWDEIAYIQDVYLDDPEAGIATYLAFADEKPDHPDAPELLYFAARIAETEGDLQYAASIWRQIGISYSFSEYGFDSFFLAGITAYRQRDYNTAESDFQSTLALANTDEQKSQAYFWIGKAQAAIGNSNGAVTNWQQASTIDPTGYYSEMANLKLNSRSPFTVTGTRDYSFDREREQLEAQAWMVAIFGIPAETDFSTSSLYSIPQFVRGQELWDLGLYESARLEFENLRSLYANDALQTYRLANHFLEIGLYRSGIIAARQVLTLAGLNDAQTLTAPRYFNHMRFGLYYQPLIFSAAESYDFDPLLLYSIIRQESLFEGFVTSSAGARGLMQIIPATGEQIHVRSGWPQNYNDQDLYRPFVNITFGADYLATQRSTFDNDIFVALSAYNGGPGNASRWQELVENDPELYVETVRFSETRNYLRAIFEIYEIYNHLYTIED